MPDMSSGAPVFREGPAAPVPMPPIPEVVKSATGIYEQALAMKQDPLPAPPITITNPDPDPVVIKNDTSQGAAKSVDVIEPVFDDEPAAPPVEPKEIEESDPDLDGVSVNEAEPVTAIPSAQLKKLKESHREVKKARKAAEAEALALKEEVQKYKTGEIIPEKLVEMNNRIAELERYEQIHNVKGSRAYREQVVAPLQDLDSKLAAIANDYGLQPEELLQGADIENRAERNRFLEERFDLVGAQEVKDLFEKRQELRSKERQIETEPLTLMEQLKEQQEFLDVQRNNQRLAGFKTTSKVAWHKAIDRIQKEGKIIGLVKQEGNEEYNSKVVTPIMQAAAKEFGKLTVDLANAGLEKLDEPLAEYLASMTLRAHASAVASMESSAAAQEVQRLNNTRDRLNTIIRPSVSSSATLAVPQGRPTPKTPIEHAQAILSQVMPK